MAWTAAYLPSCAFAESQLDYENWYQIEILIFRQRSKTATDENWPLEPRMYPARMLAIGPTNDEEIGPDSLSQARQLLASDLTPANVNDRDRQAESTPTFLFEGLSRQKLKYELLNQSPAIEEVEPDAQEESLDEAILESLLYGPLPDAYRALDADNRRLGSVARSLRVSSKFELLSHVAWRQPVVSEATAILIQTGQRYGDVSEIDGTLSISRTRFLHVAADLWYTEFTSGVSQQLLIQPSDQPVSDSDVAQRYPELVDASRRGEQYIPIHRHHLHQTRRLRSGELHYIDHPFFGILVQIVPFEYESVLDALSGTEP